MTNRLFVAALALGLSASSALATELTIMSYNVWGGGANEQKPIDDTVAVIKAVGADIIGIQETRLEGPDCTAESCPAQGESVAGKLAAALGFHVFEQTASNEALGQRHSESLSHHRQGDGQ